VHVLDVLTAEEELGVALGAPSPEACVLALARAWAVFPSARIAQLAAALSRSIPAEPLDGPTQRAREARWHEVAAAANPADLPALLATEWTSRPSDALARLEKLRGFPRDPRIVEHLLELDTPERFLSNMGMRFWRGAWTLALTWGSADAAARLPQREPPASSLPWVASRWQQVYAPVSRAFSGKLPAEPPLTPRMEACLAGLSRRVDVLDRDVDALLDAVLEHPQDDAARLVLADALSQRGDPRGEFIGLQFAHERGELPLGTRERMHRLLRAGGPRWFNALGSQVTGRAVFRRGFLAEAQLLTRAPDPRLRGWRTVEALDTAGLALPLAELLREPHLAQVRRLHEVLGESFVHLARGGVGLSFALLEVRSPVSLPSASVACAIDCLRVRDDAEEGLRWFLASGLKTTVSSLELDVVLAVREEPGRGRGGAGSRPPTRLGRLGALLARLEGEAPGVKRVALTADARSWPRRWEGVWSLEFTRGADGRLSRLRAHLGGDALARLDEVLAGLAPDQLERVELTSSVRPAPAARERLTRELGLAVRSQGRLVEVRAVLTRPLSRSSGPVIHDGR
jgi:uncharacterized protein (TIGR02996 family)